MSPSRRAVRGAAPGRGGLHRGARRRRRVARRAAARAERVVAMADLTNVEAMEYVQDRLRTMGVERALARAGAREGDVVRVGPVELDVRRGASELIGRDDRRREGRDVVDHVGRRASSTTPRCSSCAREIAAARAAGHEVVLVCSGAIAAGLPALGHRRRVRPTSARCRPSPRSASPG